MNIKVRFLKGFPFIGFQVGEYISYTGLLVEGNKLKLSSAAISVTDLASEMGQMFSRFPLPQELFLEILAGRLQRSGARLIDKLKTKLESDKEDGPSGRTTTHEVRVPKHTIIEEDDPALIKLRERRKATEEKLRKQESARATTTIADKEPQNQGSTDGL